MRYRTTDGNAAVHTLNSTAVATSRALVAIMEQNQLADGRVRVPDCLVSRMGGKTHLEPCEWGLDACHSADVAVFHGFV